MKAFSSGFAQKIEEAARDSYDFLLEPVTMIGTFTELDKPMKNIIKEQWAILNDLERNSIGENISQINYVFTEGNQLQSYSIYNGLAFLLGFFGVVILIIGLMGRRSYSKHLAMFKQVFPGMQNLEDIDRYAQMKIDRLGLVLFEPFLFSDETPMGMVDLREVNQIYISERVTNNVLLIKLNLQLHVNGSESFYLQGPMDQVNQEMLHLFNYLQEKYPNIILAY